MVDQAYSRQASFATAAAGDGLVLLEEGDSKHHNTITVCSLWAFKWRWSMWNIARDFFKAGKQDLFFLFKHIKSYTSSKSEV